jgi:two-component system, OmpR family, response regulator TctD
MRYLLVEDNLALAKAILDHLSLNGHIADHAARIETAHDYLRVSDYELILLDIMLPDGDGRQLLKEYRSNSGKTPIIALTARSQVSDRVSVLDLGADDYLTKPFDFSELEARCRAVIRRQGGTAENIKRFGNTIYDGVSGKLSVDDIPIRLRNRELRLLEVFINAPDQLFSKSKLVDRLFSYEDDVAENAIEVYVARLRKQLEGSDLKIITERGMGYRLSLL